MAEGLGIRIGAEDGMFRNEGSGIRFWGLGSGIWGLEIEDWGSGSKVEI